MFFEDFCPHFLDRRTIGRFGILLQIRIDIGEDLLPFPLSPMDVRKKQMNPGEIRVKVMSSLESRFGFFKERRFVIGQSEEIITLSRAWIKLHCCFKTI